MLKINLMIDKIFTSTVFHNRNSYVHFIYWSINGIKFTQLYNPKCIMLQWRKKESKDNSKYLLMVIIFTEINNIIVNNFWISLFVILVYSSRWMKTFCENSFECRCFI